MNGFIEVSPSRVIPKTTMLIRANAVVSVRPTEHYETGWAVIEYHIGNQATSVQVDETKEQVLRKIEEATE